MPHTPTDSLQYDIHVPTKSLGRIERAIWTGIAKVRDYTGLKPGVRIKVYMMAGINKHPIASTGPLSTYGNTTTNGISFGISPSYLNSWRFPRSLVGTAIHEYTHYLRYKHQVLTGARTVLEGALEEGIAIYLETILNKAPLYLDLRMQTESRMRLYWEKLETVWMARESKNPIVLKNQIYRAIYYRFGFGIVAQYMNAHPKLTLRQLVILPRAKLVAFARGEYEQR